MSLIKCATNRPIATTMLFLALVLLGCMSLGQLSTDFLPDLSYPVLAVRTVCPNLAPLDIEESISQHIEQAVGSVPGVRKTSSVSGEGLSLVTIEFAWGTNMDFAKLNLRERLDKLNFTLPPNAGRPTILNLDPSTEPIIILAVSGINLAQLKRFSEDVIKRRLEQIDGIALAAVSGGLEREIQIHIDPNALAKYDLSMSHIRNVLKSSNYTTHGGTLLKGSTRYALRIKSEFESLTDIENVIIESRDGTSLLLKQIAHVYNGFKQSIGLNRLNATDAIGIILMKEAGANTVSVSERVDTVLAQFLQEYPDIKISTVYNQATFISTAIGNVLQAIYLGGFCSIIVLFLFLRDVRSPLIIAVSLPVSIITSFTFFHIFKVDFNLMSFGGLALGIGLLVDNSIVVLENIFRLRDENVDNKHACVKGAVEVRTPLLASTMTTCAVFLPIAYISGVSGQLFRDLAFAVICSLIVSLAVSLILVPMLVSVFIDPDKQKNARSWKIMHSTFFRKMGDFIHYRIEYLKSAIRQIAMLPGNAASGILSKYETWLKSVLAYPIHTLCIAGFILLTTCLLLFLINKELMPPTHNPEITVTLTAPKGTPLQNMSTKVEELEELFLRHKNVDYVFTQIGLVQFGMDFSPGEISIEKSSLRIHFKEESNYSSILNQVFNDFVLPPNYELGYQHGNNMIRKLFNLGDSDIEMTISGTDFEIMNNILTSVRSGLESIDGIGEMWSDFQKGAPEIQIKINPLKCARYNLTVKQVSDIIQNRIEGIRVTQLEEVNSKTDIVLYFIDNATMPWDDLRSMKINTNAVSIPLTDLIDYRFSHGPIQIRRFNQTRVITLYINIDSRPLQNVIQDVEQYCGNVDVPPGYSIDIGGTNEEMHKAFKDLIIAFILAGLVVYMILAAQFESLKHPFIIILSIPMALIGVFWILFVTGTSLNVLSFIGIIVLVGIAVNDAIIKITYINQRRKQGFSLHDSIMSAGATRFRPIIMTSITTILGLLPLAVYAVPGAMIGKSLAISIIGGLFTSTILTLFIVPVLYYLMER